MSDASTNPGSRATARAFVMAVLGAKGGVGTTTVASNIAAEIGASTEALTGRAARVLLIDLDLYLGDIALHLGVATEINVMPYLLSSDALGAKEWETEPPLHDGGFRVLGLANDLSDADRVTAEQVIAFVQSARPHYTHIVLDCGSAMDEVSLAACGAADRRLVVVTEQRPALVGARRRIAVLRNLEAQGTVAELIVNRAHPGKGPVPAAIARAVGVPVVGSIRNAWTEHQRTLERYTTLRQAAPDSAANRDYIRLCARLFTPEPTPYRASSTPPDRAALPDPDRVPARRSRSD